MKIKNTYPRPDKRSAFMRVLRKVAIWVFLAAAVASVAVNLAIGGKPWCIVVVWSIFTASSLLFSPLVESGVIAQGTRLVLNAAVLLTLIDTLLAPGWAITAVPIMVAGSLIALSCLLFVEIKRHRVCSIPLTMSLGAAVVASALYNILTGGLNVPMLVLGCVALALFIAVCATMRGRLFFELKKYFHLR
ncbi:MAG: hypothetical protein II668_07585 [Oscillospiraceae bacterium]|nr:hypothetical protein [Oscillospiraceae bacterium]MBQ3986284.1 hypothetical protein [Oscillospiraceae bacterium]